MLPWLNSVALQQNKRRFFWRVNKQTAAEWKSRLDAGELTRPVSSPSRRIRLAADVLSCIQAQTADYKLVHIHFSWRGGKLLYWVQLLHYWWSLTFYRAEMSLRTDLQPHVIFFFYYFGEMCSQEDVLVFFRLQFSCIVIFMNRGFLMDLHLSRVALGEIFLYFHEHKQHPAARNSHQSTSINPPQKIVPNNCSISSYYNEQLTSL